MKYINPNNKKIRNSFIMSVRCGPCKEELVLYQKVGVGNLLRMKLDRVIETQVDLWNTDSFNCPNCNAHLGDKIDLDGNIAFRIIRGMVHTRRVD